VKVDLEEAIVYLRELLAMSRDELDQEAYGRHSDPSLKAKDVTKKDVLLFAFDKKWNKDAKCPFERMRQRKALLDPFNSLTKADLQRLEAAKS